MTVIGHEISTYDRGDHVEEQRWIGKPWRRVELLTQRYFWKGEEFDRGRDLTFHLGLRRLGLAFTFIVSRQSVLDYSEERP